MRTLPELRSAIPEIETGRRLLARIVGARDVPEPVAAWRAVPEEELCVMEVAQKSAFIGALLPLARRGRKVEQRALRRLYQLFTFVEMPERERHELVAALHTRLRLAPDPLPIFDKAEIPAHADDRGSWVGRPLAVG